LFFVVLKKFLQGITVIELDLVHHRSREGWRSRLRKLYQGQACLLPFNMRWSKYMYYSFCHYS
jgi:hypothetical protein